MKAALVTDASFCELTGSAAWAAWAESERRQILVGNALPGRHGAVNPVEMRAVALGRGVAIKRGLIARGDHFTLQTDSTHAAGRLMPSHLSRRNKMRARRGLPIVPPQHPDNGSP